MSRRSELLPFRDYTPVKLWPSTSIDYLFLVSFSPFLSFRELTQFATEKMKLLRVIIFLVLLVGVLATVSNINLNPTGNYARISTKGGMYVSIIMLIYVLFGEFGYLPFTRFVGRKRRSISGQMMGPMLGDRDTMLKVNILICLFSYSSL